MESTLFEAITGSFGDALALFGGARQTRLTQDANPSDTALLVERADGLPSPGQVTVGRITYSYTQAQGTTLTGIQAIVGGTYLPGVIAHHPAYSGVIDVSGAFSELDGLRRSLFLDTATGEDLANLGRSLGVLRNPMLADDDQYREVVKALAYARRGTKAALTTLLDAVLGPGNYTIDEDPFAHPGQVQVSVPPSAIVSKTSLGKTYVSSDDPGLPEGDGTFKAPAPAYGHAALIMAPLSLLQPTTTAIPSAAQPAGTWAWSGPNEAQDVQLVADTAAPTTAARLMTLNGFYRAAQPQLLSPPRAELTLVCQIIRPNGLGTALGSAGASVANGLRLLAWGARAGGGGTQVAIINAVSKVALSAWVQLPDGYSSITLRLTRATGSLWVGGSMVAMVAASALPGSTESVASFGNIARAAQSAGGSSVPQLAVRYISLTARPTRDLWQGEGGDAATVVPDKVVLASGGLDSRHVGHKLITSGGTASRGRNNGTWRILEVVDPNTARLAGENRGGGALSASGGSTFFAPAPEETFAYPDDLGKSVVVVSGGSGRVGTYTITALYEPVTGRDLATYATAGLRCSATKAKVSGSSVTPGTNLAWRLDPVMVAEQGLFYVLSDAGTVTASAQGQTLTPWQPLPSDTAPYVMVRRRVLGGVVREATAATNKVADVGPPVRLLTNPLYVHAPLEALDAYLPAAAGAGVNVVVRYG